MQVLNGSPAGVDDVGLAAHRRSRQGPIKLAIFLISLAACTVAFLAFDWMYSRAIKRASQSAPERNLCRVPDPVRHHALKANCVSTVHWGRDSYEFVTNSIGLRDEKIREVPVTDARPRILLLGDSFTEGESAWGDSYAGKIAARLPEYDFLNGAVAAYSPSNYLNVTRKLLADGFDIDEIIVFLDNSAVHYEAAFYRDLDGSGAVGGPGREHRRISWYGNLRFWISSHLFVTNDIFQFVEQQLVQHGYYHLVASISGNDTFDLEWAAWTYRPVNESDGFPTGYAPLGVEGGIAREKAKMDLLWRELEKRHIPLSVVVYPFASQLVHDTVDSRQVRIWREWCEGKCKRFIDAFPGFFAVKERCSPLQRGCWYLDYFIFGDMHYSAAGNAMVADILVRSLTEDPPVKQQAGN
jgi:hypothetical protein